MDLTLKDGTRDLGFYQLKRDCSCAPGSKILLYFRTQRLPPSNRFKSLLVEVVGQITPAEPYKNRAPTIFEMLLPIRGDYTSLFALPVTARLRNTTVTRREYCVSRM